MDLEIDNLPKILPPKSDFVFKILFGDKRNIPYLIDLLKSVLKRNIENVILVDTAIKPMYAGDKKGILDVKAELDNGELVDIEIQVEPRKDMRARTTYYSSSMITEQLGSGDRYFRLKPAINIIISEKTIIHESAKCHNVFSMLEKDEHFAFNNLQEIHVLDLSRIGNETDRKLFNWLTFINSDKEEDFMAVAQEDKIIKGAFGVLKIVSADKARRMEYLARLKEQRDIWSREYYAEERGMEKRALEIARNMKAKGYDLHAIADVTGLTFDEVLNV